MENASLALMSQSSILRLRTGLKKCAGYDNQAQQFIGDTKHKAVVYVRNYYLAIAYCHSKLWFAKS